MEQNDDAMDLSNINQINLDDIDPQEFLDAITGNDSIQMDFVHQHSTNIGEFQQNGINFIFISFIF